MKMKAISIFLFIISVISLGLIKAAYDAWIKNDGLQTTLSGMYVVIFRLYSSEEYPSKIQFSSGTGFTEDHAITLTLLIAFIFSCIALLGSAITSLHLKKCKQLSAFTGAFGFLGIGLILLVAK